MGSPGLCDIFWRATDKNSTPLGLMSQQSSLNSPLLFFHLTCAAACDAATAVKAAERLARTPCVTAYDTDFMARNGSQVRSLPSPHSSLPPPYLPHTPLFP